MNPSQEPAAAAETPVVDGREQKQKTARSDPPQAVGINQQAQHLPTTRPSHDENDGSTSRQKVTTSPSQQIIQQTPAHTDTQVCLFIMKFVL